MASLHQIGQGFVKTCWAGGGVWDEKEAEELPGAEIPHKTR